MENNGQHLQVPWSIIFEWWIGSIFNLKRKMAKIIGFRQPYYFSILANMIMNVWTNVHVLFFLFVCDLYIIVIYHFCSENFIFLKFFFLLFFFVLIFYCIFWMLCLGEVISLGISALELFLGDFWEKTGYNGLKYLAS